MNTRAELIVLAALATYAKPWSHGGGGLSYDELARATRLGSHDLVVALTGLHQQGRVSRYLVDGDARNRRLFYIVKSLVKAKEGQSGG